MGSGQDWATFFARLGCLGITLLVFCILLVGLIIYFAVHH